MGVLDNVKEVADLVKKIGDIDLYRKIVHTENEVIELTHQLRAAQQRIRELEATLSQKQLLTFKAPFYFVEGDLVPFCARCWEADQKPIHMVLEGAGQVSYASYNCPSCNKKVPLSGAAAKFMPPDAGSPDPHWF